MENIKVQKSDVEKTGFLLLALYLQYEQKLVDLFPEIEKLGCKKYDKNDYGDFKELSNVVYHYLNFCEKNKDNKEVEKMYDALREVIDAQESLSSGLILIKSILENNENIDATIEYEKDFANMFEKAGI